MIRMTSGLHLRVLISEGPYLIGKLIFWLFIYSKLRSLSALNACICWDFSKLVIYVASHFHMIVLLHDINPQMRVSSSFNLYFLCTNTQFSMKENACFFFWQESVISSAAFFPS